MRLSSLSRRSLLAGFTLLELILTIAIGLTLIGGVVFLLVEDTEADQVESVAQDFRNMVRDGRMRALATDDAYSIRMEEGSLLLERSYLLGEQVEAEVMQTLKLPSGLRVWQQQESEYQVMEEGWRWVIPNRGLLGPQAFLIKASESEQTIQISPLLGG